MGRANQATTKLARALATYLNYQKILRLHVRSLGVVTTRTLLNACELLFEQRVLCFHEAERGVRLPSAARVRKSLLADALLTQRCCNLLVFLRTCQDTQAFGA